MSDLFLHPNPPARQTAVAWWQQLSIADGLLFLVVALATILRLANLDRIPLSPSEAEAALGAWGVGQVDTSLMAVASPAYFSLTALVIQIAGASDSLARLIPALFLIGLVLLPRMLQHRLGVVGMLVTSLLLAVSPLAAISARTAGGDAIALFAILLLLVAWIRFSESADRRWWYTGTAALALGLTSAPLFYTGLITMLPVWGLTRNGEKGSWRQIQLPASVAGQWPKMVLLFTTVFLAAGSYFLTHLPALGGAASQLGIWLQGFGAGELTMTALFDPFLTLLRYEPILLPLGLAALAWVLLYAEHPLARRCLLWLGALLVFLLLQTGNIVNTAVIILPGYLLLGTFANKVLQNLADGLSWLFAGSLMVIGALIFVNVARFSRIVLYDVQELTNVWLALIAFVFTAVTIFFLWAWDEQATNQGLMLATLALFVFYTWGTAWWLGHMAANDVRERWVLAPTTDDDIHQLTTIIRQTSGQATGNTSEATIFSSVDTPVLRWYLRDFPRLALGHTLPTTTQPDMIISDIGTDPVLSSDYFGTDLGLLRTGVDEESTASTRPIIAPLHWWLFHESKAVIQEQRIVLWIRADLTQE